MAPTIRRRARHAGLFGAASHAPAPHRRCGERRILPNRATGAAAALWPGCRSVRAQERKSSAWACVSLCLVEQSVERFLCLQRFPDIPYRSVGIRAVEGGCRDLPRDDPILDVGAVDSRIALAFVKKQIDLVGDPGSENVDVGFPGPVESGSKDHAGVVVEDHESQIMHGSDPIGMLSALFSESLAEQ